MNITLMQGPVPELNTACAIRFAWTLTLPLASVVSSCLFSARYGAAAPVTGCNVRRIIHLDGGITRGVAIFRAVS